MEGAQIFSTQTNSSMRNLFAKKEEGLFLKVEGTKISGRGNICNAEGRNGYVDEFSFSVTEIEDVVQTEYQGLPALSFTAYLKGIYGSKKCKIFLPQIKNIDAAARLLRNIKMSLIQLQF